MLMPGGWSDDKNVRYKNVLNNPHIVDWYFSYRLDSFLQVVFDGILGCDWRWHRFEWQGRSAIHGHGCARFKNDPGLIMLTQRVYEGRCAERSLLAGEANSCQTTTDKYNKSIIDGKAAEKIVITYTNTLLTAMNPRTDLQVENVCPNPHPCSLDRNTIPTDQYNDDYEAVVNCCQSKNI
jgi:hypothetical protein